MPELDWQNKKHKYKHTTLTEKNSKNTVVWQINNSKKLNTKMDKNPNRVLTIILDMHTIYTKYLNETNHMNKQYNQILIIVLKLEYKL